MQNPDTLIPAPFLRVTVDTVAPDVALLKEVIRDTGITSKRIVFTTGLRIFSWLVRAHGKGLRAGLVDKDGKIQDYITWELLPVVAPQIPDRSFSCRKVSESTVRGLLAVATLLKDPQLEWVAVDIGRAAWDPTGKGRITEACMSQLLIICLSRNNRELRRFTCDFLTMICTDFESFEDMVSQAIHYNKPTLDVSRFEQRFLADQYKAELAERFGRKQ